MDSTLLPLLAAVAAGAYVQAVTGFALGIVVLSAVAVLHLGSITMVANALNIMMLATGCVVVLPRLKHVHWRIVAISVTGLMPAMVAGVLILGYLSVHAQQTLHLLLGVLILAGGLVLAYRPQPRPRLSRPAGFVVAAAMSGILAGLFSVAAPPLVYQLYRQPLSVLTVRTTLITLFCTVSAGRLATVALAGQLTGDAVRVGLLAIPMVAIGSWIGSHFPPRLSEQTMRRAVFTLLAITGLFIIVF